MDKQKRFSYQPTKPMEPVVSGGVPEADVPRLSGQNQKILELLRKGPRTNSELATVALKYTSRLSDIRKWLLEWYPDLKIKKQSLGGGVFEYRLECEENQ